MSLNNVVKSAKVENYRDIQHKFFAHGKALLFHSCQLHCTIYLRICLQNFLKGFVVDE